jgi:hypothetical protein
MKTLLVMLPFLFASLQQAPRINGKYRVEYDKNYGLQAFQVTFNDSTYSKRMPDAVTSGGKIRYEKYKVTLRKDNNEDPMVIDVREIGRDTMKFAIRSKIDPSRNVYYGKLIRIP